MQRVSLSDALEELVADLEFGLTEESLLLGGDERSGDGEELFAGFLFHLFGEFLGLGFLFGGQGSCHRGFSRARGFANVILNHAEVNGNCTNFRAAYPTATAEIELSCSEPQASVICAMVC